MIFLGVLPVGVMSYGSDSNDRTVRAGATAWRPWPMFNHAKVLRRHPTMSNYEFLRRLGL